MSNKKKRIKYILEGESFEDGYSLYEMNSSLTEFRNLVESSYKTITGIERLSSKQRSKFKIISKEFSDGSLITDLEIIFASVKFMNEIAYVPLSPNNIWSLTKETWDFIKLVYSNSDKDNHVETKQVGDKVEVNFHGDVTIVDSEVYLNAKQSKGNYKNLTDLTKNYEVDNIKAESDGNTDIEISDGDEDLFDMPALADDRSYTLAVEIYNFNRRTQNGRLEVLEGDIQEGEYSFHLPEQTSISKSIRSMERKRVRVQAEIEWIDDPLEGKIVNKIILLDVNL